MVKADGQVIKNGGWGDEGRVSAQGHSNPEGTAGLWMDGVGKAGKLEGMAIGWREGKWHEPVGVYLHGEGLGWRQPWEQRMPTLSEPAGHGGRCSASTDGDPRATGPQGEPGLGLGRGYRPAGGGGGGSGTWTTQTDRERGRARGSQGSQGGKARGRKGRLERAGGTGHAAHRPPLSRQPP